ncbi:acyl-CoA reductase [Rhodocytophaga rosea]|uniref:Acyl-CoA reductase n=2 Tax=Rhodocytophaga rosea TaxID=2704465 RepID=A0A6C0GWH2_9BACT|nr:acyl-CoA reductase [Rhodocytophaga rosea]
MILEERINAFIALGKKLAELPAEQKQAWASQARSGNNWFTEESVEMAIRGIIDYLQEDALRKWLADYSFGDIQKRVGVVMAGNIPAVGFHDFMSVLLSGHILYAKLSSQDEILPKKIAALLLDIEPGFASQLQFMERLNKAQAIIATGSDNSARYFKYYFGKVPNIIRQNRTSCAVLSGEENTQDFVKLGEDIFHYFGLGCRNVSKLYVPQDYDFTPLLDALAPFKNVMNHNKYVNNYDYNKSILLVNQVPHYDNGFLLLTENTSLVSPVSVVYYEYYTNAQDLAFQLELHRSKIQCVVTGNENIPGSIPFGQAQHPQVWDYADGVDTMQFLQSLS